VQQREPPQGAVGGHGAEAGALAVRHGGPPDVPEQRQERQQCERRAGEEGDAPRGVGALQRRARAERDGDAEGAGAAEEAGQQRAALLPAALQPGHEGGSGGTADEHARPHQDGQAGRGGRDEVGDGHAHEAGRGDGGRPVPLYRTGGGKLRRGVCQQEGGCDEADGSEASVERAGEIVRDRTCVPEVHAEGQPDRAPAQGRASRHVGRARPTSRSCP
jgi:hypothetical protein